MDEMKDFINLKRINKECRIMMNLLVWAGKQRIFKIKVFEKIFLMFFNWLFDRKSKRW